MAENRSSTAIVVGVIEGQRAVVLRTAARYAADLGARLVIAHVDPDRYLLGEYYDGSTSSVPLSVDLVDLGEPTITAVLATQIEEALADVTIERETRALGGDPAIALADLAAEVDARMIIVGTREHGVLASIAEFLSGSVAVHLAHRQTRPVLVVPVDDDSTLRTPPWEESA